MPPAPGDSAVDSATEDDIKACFRLLLGRTPNPEEWRGHSSRAGEPLPGIVASYLNSLEFQRRGLTIIDRTGETVLTRLDGFAIYSAADDAAVGKLVQEDNYDKDVTAVFRRWVRPGMNVVDVGANIGYFTLLSAAIVGPKGSVLAVEPNPRNVRLLEASRRLNGFENITVCQAAAGARTGLLTLNTSHSNGTTSAVDADLNSLLGSETVASLTLDALVPQGRRIDLVKIDVEGAEYTALQGGRGMLERWRPVLISEFSPTMMPGISGVSGPDYLRWLIELGYGFSVVEADGSETPAGADVDAVMVAFQRRGKSHLDLVCQARGKSKPQRGFFSAYRR